MKTLSGEGSLSSEASSTTRVLRLAENDTAALRSIAACGSGD